MDVKWTSEQKKVIDLRDRGYTCIGGSGLQERQLYSLSV